MMKFYFDLMNLYRPNAASSISKTTDEGTKKNVVISQLFKGLTLVLTCILKCTFNANFQIHLYRMCLFFFLILHQSFFFIYDFIFKEQNLFWENQLASSWISFKNFADKNFKESKCVCCNTFHMWKNM